MLANGRWHGIWIEDRFFCYSPEGDAAQIEESLDAARDRAPESEDSIWKNAVVRRFELKLPIFTKKGTLRGERMHQLPKREVSGFTLPIASAFALLIQSDFETYFTNAFGERTTTGDDLRFWQRSALFALELLLRGRYVPDVELQLKTGRGVWRPSLDMEGDLERYYMLADAMPPVCLAHDNRESKGRGQSAEESLFSFISAIIDNQIRQRMSSRKDLASMLQFPAAASDRVAVLWWKSLLNPGHAPSFIVTPQEGERLAANIRDWTKAYHPLRNKQEGKADLLRLGLRLDPPDGGEAGASEWTLHFHLQPQDDPSLQIPAIFIWQQRKEEMRWFERRFYNAQEALLARLAEAARLYPLLERELERPRPQALRLSTEEAYRFLREYAPVLREGGTSVELPAWWSREGRRRIGLQLKLKAAEANQGASASSKGRLGIAQLAQFDAKAAVGDETVTAEELERLASLKVPLVPFRGEWMEVNPEEIRQALRYMKDRPTVELSYGELLHIATQGGGVAEVQGIPVADYELPPAVQRLLDGDWDAIVRERAVPAALNGTLRHYQERGFHWLAAMRELGFGVCLADDMGLGKTIQVITLLLDSFERGAAEPALVVCPTSLLGTWRHELARFAPGLRVVTHHGPVREHGDFFARQAKQFDVVLTTYHLIARDEADFKKIVWSNLIVDEAQNIKNETAKQTQSIMRLSAANRVAVTGTPIENRLNELWSIIHFLNPGYLGSVSTFRSRFALPIERYHDRKRTQQLKRLVAPFILRRLKTDPNISKDLPDKIETKIYCGLTKEQASLYQATVQDMLRQVDDSEGIRRKGLVLAGLTKLKQICDHPALFLQDGGAAPNRSGKLKQLLELVASIRETSESVIIFTQYIKMGEMLVEYLRRQTGEAPLFLHGGVPKKDRDVMIDSFQRGGGPSVFILSLKAGGVGLTLTRASHVIHFDRWWNPAVENQATDRAHRIGQTRNVQVHTFICTGTLEERIDEMIEAKRMLTEQVIGTGEHWLTELSGAELRHLLELRENSLQDDLEEAE